LLRDPVETIMSHVFQSPEIHTPFLFNKNGELDGSKVNKYLRNYFMNFDPNVDHISNWIDSEFYSYTSIDLYKYHYDPEKGYSILNNENFDIALISIEKLNRKFSQVMKELTGTSKEIQIINKNVTVEKDDAKLYKNVKKNITIPKEDLRRVYSTKFAKHFFSPEFRANMIAKWSVPRN